MKERCKLVWESLSDWQQKEIQARPEPIEQLLKQRYLSSRVRNLGRFFENGWNKKMKRDELSWEGEWFVWRLYGHQIAKMKPGGGGFFISTGIDTLTKVTTRRLSQLVPVCRKNWQAYVRIEKLHGDELLPFGREWTFIHQIKG